MFKQLITLVAVIMQSGLPKQAYFTLFQALNTNVVLDIIQ